MQQGMSTRSNENTVCVWQRMFLLYRWPLVQATLRRCNWRSINCSRSLSLGQVVLIGFLKRLKMDQGKAPLSISITS